MLTQLQSTKTSVNYQLPGLCNHVKLNQHSCTCRGAQVTVYPLTKF